MSVYPANNINSRRAGVIDCSSNTTQPDLDSHSSTPAQTSGGSVVPPPSSSSADGTDFSDGLSCFILAISEPIQSRSNSQSFLGGVGRRAPAQRNQRARQHSAVDCIGSAGLTRGSMVGLATGLKRQMMNAALLEWGRLFPHLSTSQRQRQRRLQSG